MSVNLKEISENLKNLPLSSPLPKPASVFIPTHKLFATKCRILNNTLPLVKGLIKKTQKHIEQFNTPIEQFQNKRIYLNNNIEDLREKLNKINKSEVEECKRLLNKIGDTNLYKKIKFDHKETEFIFELISMHDLVNKYPFVKERIEYEYLVDIEVLERMCKSL